MTITEHDLQLAIDNGIVNEDELKAAIENMTRNKILENHPFSIWQNKEGQWLTKFLVDGKKVKVRRNDKRALEDYIVEYYKKNEDKITVETVFLEWSAEKLKYNEFRAQSYDRYRTDFKRFFGKDQSICRKQFKNISAVELETFIKDTIIKYSLTKKAYSGLVSLIRAIWKFGKKNGYTNLSITSFFDELDLSKKMFRSTKKMREECIYMEDEIKLLASYLKAHPDIWNLGLLLQIQTGMRIGEIVALKPEDFMGSFIRVSRTEVKYKDDEGKWKVAVFDMPKTDAGNRDLILTPSAIDTIKMIQDLHVSGEFLFMNKGKRIRENTFNKRLHIVCDEIGIQFRSTHKLRATYGTMLIDGNVNDSVIAEQMGHTDINTTRKYYYFSNKSYEKKKEQILEAVFV